MNRADMISTVISAYDNLKAAGTYGFSGTQEEYQEIASGVGIRRASNHRQSERSLEGRVQLGTGGAGDAVEVSFIQSDETYNNNEVRVLIDFNMALDIIQAEGGLFVKVNEVGGDISDQRIAALDEDERNTINASFPTPWVNILQTPEQMADYLAFLDSEHTDATFFSSLNLENLLRVSNAPVLTPEMVLTIEQGKSETEGETVFILTLDPAQVYATMGLEDLFDARTMAGDVDSMLTEIFTNMTITQEVVLVAGEDGTLLPNRITTNLGINVSFSADATDTEDDSEPLSLELIMNSETVTNFTDIGAAFTIAAPALE